MSFLNSKVSAPCVAFNRRWALSGQLPILYSSRTGITLVEVVVGLILLSTLFVSMLGAFHTHRQQIQNAALRTKAIEACDELVATWQTSAAPIPVNARGTWNDKFRWTTRLTGQSMFGPIAIHIVTLDVYDARTGDPKPLVSFELADRRGESQ